MENPEKPEKTEQVEPQAAQSEQAAAIKGITEKGEPALSKQLADYKETLQRLQAEFENYKKRAEKEKAQFRQFAAAEIAKSFLPVLDSFEIALKSINRANNEAVDGKFIKGIELIYGQFYSVLQLQGLRPIKAVGQKLDPYTHEVLMQEEAQDEKKDGIIVEEFQKGYLFNGMVLRFSKVKVLKYRGKESMEVKKNG